VRALLQCRDAADDHLTAELVHLDNLKKMLESHLNLVKIQLQTLNAARERLTAVFRERARVIDLLCYAMPCVGALRDDTVTGKAAIPL